MNRYVLIVFNGEITMQPKKLILFISILFSISACGGGGGGGDTPTADPAESKWGTLSWGSGEWKSKNQ